MNASVTIETLDQAGVDLLVSSINIPPRPSILQDLQTEMAKENIDPRVIASIAAKDVALTAAVLKVINSPFYGLRRQVDSLTQAVMFLGARQVSALITGLVARQVLKAEGPDMFRFWDVSSKRAFSLLRLSKQLSAVEPDIAQTFGLFCDLGIPLLLHKFPGYLTTLGSANDGAGLSFTSVERAVHHTDHAFVGAVMAKTWGLSPIVSMAIQRHHEYGLFQDDKVPQSVQDLVAMGLLAERIIQMYAGQNQTVEWSRGGEAALAHLTLSEYEFDELRDDIHEGFSGD